MPEDDNGDEHKFVSGWDYIKEKHLGTIIIIVVIAIIIGFIYISSQSTNPKSDCEYEENGCQGDNRWGQ